MKFNWKYTVISIVILAITLATTAFLVGGDSSLPSSPSPVGTQPVQSDSNYSL